LGEWSEFPATSEAELSPKNGKCPKKQPFASLNFPNPHPFGNRGRESRWNSLAAQI
jgi:hypothetical protein